MNERELGMENHNYLIALALILISTKFFSSVSKKAHLPQVVGALLAGIVLGPSMFGIIDESEFINHVSTIGVIMLMFLAGIDTELDELKKTGLKSCFIALSGAILPFIVGTGIYLAFYSDIANINEVQLLEAFFIGVVISATSVTITVETLREMGYLKGKMGSAIVGAAIIDDIIGIIMLTIISNFKSSDVEIGGIFLNILAYFAFLVIVGFIAHKLFVIIEKRYFHMRRVAIYAFSFCLFMAWASEVLFGITDITGAYFAGLILCNIMDARQYIARKFVVTSYMFFAPVFFASIGISTDLHSLNTSIILFSIVLLTGAILSKFVGCGLTAKLSGFNNQESMAIGAGMVSRGEVALIVAQKGAAINLIKPSLFPAIVLVVIVTTLITPILLKFILRKDSHLLINNP